MGEALEVIDKGSDLGSPLATVSFRQGAIPSIEDVLTEIANPGFFGLSGIIYGFVEEVDSLNFSRLEDLNNFFTRVPGGYLWRQMKEGHKRLNSPLTEGQIIYDSLKTGGDGASIIGMFKGFTFKRINKTPRQFFEEIEKAANNCGLNNATLIEVIDRLNAAPNQEIRDGIKGELFTLILPVYKLLRSKGYSHRDLCS